ncbi:MAG: glycosyltransferase family 39 protein [Candidatus Daviesbacteria bacterium]|nr:glycosyltransferase family 39 protein [Candidatus Daviesbacteria bacterium]
MNRKFLIFFLGLILLFSFILRFYKVNEIPPSLNWDEVSIAYNAYSILKTGKDEWGQFFPVHFKAYGEYKLPVQVYGSIPGITIFGLNELGVRITPVVYGTLTVLIMFFLGQVLFRNNLVGLLSSFLLAISPWHIQLTRASYESSFALFWVILGTWLLIKGFEDRKWFIWSMIPFAASVFTYNSARIFTPLFLMAVAIIYRHHLIKVKRTVLISMIVFTILILPLTPFLFGGERSARYKLVSITDDPGLIPRIEERRNNSILPSPLTRLIHNRITYVSFYFTRNYLAHFTPDFLFINGAPHKQHHVQGMGQLYWFQAPFLFLGFFLLFKKKNEFRWLIMSWILLIYIPVSVTNDSIPHALRSAIATPVYQLLTAFGIYQAYLLIKNKKMLWQFLLWGIVVTIGLWQFISYLINYYTIYPKNYSRDWQYGYKQVLEYIRVHKDEYDEIVFTRHFGEPHMFTLFYLNYDPAKYQTDPNLVRFETYDWVRVLRFDKYYFPDLGDRETQFADIVRDNPGEKLLFIGREGDFPKEMPRLLSIDFLNGDNAFDVVEVR